MKEPKYKIVKVYNEGDIVEPIGGGYFRLISKASSKPARPLRKAPSSLANAPLPTKKATEPAQPARAPRRSHSKIDPVVRLALLTCNCGQLWRLYSDTHLALKERDMIFEVLMTGTRYTQIPL
jgi:hypothetical protein